MTTPRGAATRARIVEAASRLVAARGVAGTRLDDVMVESGTSKSQIYHYFSDREDLMNAVVEAQSKGVLEFQESCLLKVESLEDLRAWRDKIVRFNRSNGSAGGCPIGSLASELADRSETGRQALAASFALWEKHLATALRAIQKRGELDPAADVDKLATAMIGALQGGLLMAQTMRTTHPLELALDMALEHVTRRGWSTRHPVEARPRKQPGQTKRPAARGKSARIDRG